MSKQKQLCHRRAVFVFLVTVLHSAVHRTCHYTLFAATSEELRDSCETDKDVDDCFEPHPVAEHQVDDVPVRIKEVSNTDETPVEGTNDEEYLCDF